MFKKIKYFSILFVLSFILVGCNKENNIQTSEINETIDNIAENDEFDKVFEDFTGLTENIREEKDEFNVSQPSSSSESVTVVDVSQHTDEDLGLIVDFIDVGQGDSILIKSNNEYMLVDAGDVYTSDSLYKYVSTKTSNLKYFIGTHPHKDHIGGAPEILKNLEVNNVIINNVPNDKISSYKEMMEIINEKEIPIIEPIVGEEYQLGDATFIILAPNSNEYKDLNDFSIVIKVIYKDTSFLLCGDAENLSENEIMETGFDISANVLKVGHHGSKYSTSRIFLDTVNPSVAVISVGEDNQYNHPHEDLISKLNTKQILTFRTDINGTISIGSDGTNIYSICEKVEEKEDTIKIETSDEIDENIEEPIFYPEDDETFIVYTTRDGKYHNEGCSELSKVYNTVNLGIAKQMGYVPCDKCNTNN